MIKTVLTRNICAGAIICALGIAGCERAASSPEDAEFRAEAVATLNKACNLNTQHDAEYCACHAEQVAATLNRETLAQYVEMTEHSLKAFSTTNKTVQEENFRAMSESMGDTTMMLKIARATAKAMKACGQAL